MAPHVRTKKPSDYVNPSYRRAGKHFEERKHSLVIDAQGASNKTIQTESGTLRFENGVAMVPGTGTRAKDIVDEISASRDPSVRLHPKQYALSENRQTVNTDRTHRYFFGGWPEMPWKQNQEDTASIQMDGANIQEDRDERAEQRDRNAVRGADEL